MQVHMSQAVEERMWSFVEAVPKVEIGGCGYGWLMEDGNVAVDEIFLMPQEVSGGKVDFKDGAFAFLIEKAIRDEVLGREDLVYVSWHSHNSMGVFFSGTDEEGVKDYGNTGIPHLISMVVNLKHEVRVRYDAFNLVHHGVPIKQVTMEGVDFVSEIPPPPAVDPIIAAEIEAFVSMRQWLPKKQAGFQPKFHKSQTGLPGAKVEKALEDAEKEADRQVEEALKHLESDDCVILEGWEAAEYIANMDDSDEAVTGMRVA